MNDTTLRNGPGTGQNAGLTAFASLNRRPRT